MRRRVLDCACRILAAVLVFLTLSGVASAAGDQRFDLICRGKAQSPGGRPQSDRFIMNFATGR